MNSVMKTAIITFAITIFLLNPGFVSAENTWSININAKTLTAENLLIIGQNPEASDGIDGLFDIQAFLAGDIHAYIELENESYWSNIKESCSAPCTKTWSFFIESVAQGQPIELNWNLFPLPENMSVILIDTETGQSIDMTEGQPVYTYQNAGTREFIVEAETW